AAKAAEDMIDRILQRMIRDTAEKKKIEGKLADAKGRSGQRQNALNKVTDLRLSGATGSPEDLVKDMPDGYLKDAVKSEVQSQWRSWAAVIAAANPSTRIQLIQAYALASAGQQSFPQPSLVLTLLDSGMNDPNVLIYMLRVLEGMPLDTAPATLQGPVGRA